MKRFIRGLAVAALAAACATPFDFAAPAAAPVPKNEANGRKADALQRLRSKNNLTQILIAIHNNQDAFQQLPQNICDKNGKPLLSWRVHLLQYLDKEKLYAQFKLDEPWDSEHNKKLLTKMPDVYRVGFEPKGETKTYYQGFTGPGAFFERGKKLSIPTDFPDGTSRTFAVAEAGPPVDWTRPLDIPYDPKAPLTKLEGPFSNTLNAATVDGAAHSFRRDIDDKDLRRLIERADGGVFSPEDFSGTFPLTAEDLEAGKQLIKQNEKIGNDITAKLKEQQTLLLELAKQPNAKDAGKYLEAIEGTRRGLTEKLEKLKERTEALKKHLEDAKKEPADAKK